MKVIQLLNVVVQKYRIRLRRYKIINKNWKREKNQISNSTTLNQAPTISQVCARTHIWKELAYVLENDSRLETNLKVGFEASNIENQSERMELNDVQLYIIDNILCMIILYNITCNYIYIDHLEHNYRISMGKRRSNVIGSTQPKPSSETKSGGVF